MAETELERAEKRFAQAKARLMALKNREATKSRKMDTRRKVILGGALVDLAERDSSAAAMLDRLLRNLPREQDRVAFEGWTLGSDKAAGGADGEAVGDGTSVPDTTPTADTTAGPGRSGFGSGSGSVNPSALDDGDRA